MAEAIALNPYHLGILDQGLIKGKLAYVHKPRQAQAASHEGISRPQQPGGIILVVNKVDEGKAQGIGILNAKASKPPGGALAMVLGETRPALPGPVDSAWS